MTDDRRIMTTRSFEKCRCITDQAIIINIIIYNSIGFLLDNLASLFKNVSNYNLHLPLYTVQVQHLTLFLYLYIDASIPHFSLHSWNLFDQILSTSSYLLHYTFQVKALSLLSNNSFAIKYNDRI